MSSDPACLGAMSGEARRTAEARADWRKNSARLLEAYELALKVRR